MRGWLLLFIVALPCQAIRNPFIPAINLCHTPFDSWQLRGVFIDATRASLALVSTPQGWRRFRSEEEAWPGWQVARIQPNALQLRSVNACAPVTLTMSDKKRDIYGKEGFSHNTDAGVAFDKDERGGNRKNIVVGR